MNVYQGAEQTKRNKDGFSKFNDTYASNCPPLSLLKLTLKQLPMGNKYQKINGNKNKDMIIVDDYGDL